MQITFFSSGVHVHLVKFLISIVSTVPVPETANIESRERESQRDRSEHRVKIPRVLERCSLVLVFRWDTFPEIFTRCQNFVLKLTITTEDKVILCS